MKRLFIALAFTAIALTGCYSLAEDITPPPGYVYSTPVPSEVPTEIMYFPFNPPDPQNGAAIFVEKCAPCHGDTGLGDGPEAVDLPNPVAPLGDPALARDRTPEDWFRRVTEGNIEKYMPPFLSLTERERWDVVAYAFSLTAAEDSVALGETLYEERCAACHGAGGRGDGAQALEEDLSPGDFTDQSVMAERSVNLLVEGIAHPDLDLPPESTADLSADDLVALAEYVRTFTYESTATLADAPDTESTEAAPTAEAVAEATDEEALLQGVVIGQVTNASGGVTPEGLEVTLYGFDQFQQVFTATATLDAEGGFRFEDVEMPEGRAFLAAVDYARGTYTSDIAVAGAVPGELLLSLSIFESMSDTTQISIDRLHIFFEFLSADTVRVAELILVTNPTNQMIVSEEEGQPVLEFELPPGAVNLQFQEGAVGTTFTLTENGFGDLRGISPGIGQHQILFSFDMPYSRNFSLGQTLDYPISALVVLMPDVGVTVDSEFLASDGFRDIEGRSYELFTGGNLAPGTPLPVSLSGTADFGGTGFVSDGDSTGTAIGLVALGVAFLAVGVWLYRRQRAAAPAAPVEVAEDPLPEHIAEMTAEELMDAVIALDDRFRAGDLPEGPYRNQRRLLKDRLRTLMGGAS